jgi:uncharacterized protein YukE
MDEYIERLKASWRAFQGDWERCKEVWKDDVSEKFEEDFIKPWYEVNELIHRLEELNEKLSEARRNFL